MQPLPRPRTRPGSRPPRRRTLVALLLSLTAPAAAAEGPAAPALPDGVAAFGARDVAAAWLVLPTDRYAHGVLGDAVEAGGLEVLTSDGRRLLLTLPENRVFEDRVPRLVDLDGDGRDEILLVESDRDLGARLSVYRLGPEGLALRAATPFVGKANRWLNPAGVADFSPEPGLEIALVLRPHLDGDLQFWSYDAEAGTLDLLADRAGFSNHAIGSRDLGLSAVVPDQDGDGHADLLLPATGRRALALVGLRHGDVAILWEEVLASPVSRDFRWEGADLLVEQDGGTPWRRRFD